MNLIRGRLFASRYFAFIAVAALAFSIASAVSADITKKHITLGHEAVIGGTKLPVGDYLLEIDNDHLTVMREKKVVAETATHWEARNETPSRDAVLIGDGDRVLEIRFAHDRSVLIMAPQ